MSPGAAHPIVAAHNDELTGRRKPRRHRRGDAAVASASQGDAGVSHSNSMMPQRTRGRIRAFCALAAIVAGAGAAAPAQAAPTATDWSSVSGNVAAGTVQGARVDLKAATASGRVWETPTSRVDGSWPYFAGPTFAPSLAKSDVIQIGGAPGAEYTISFRDGAGNPVSVKDPVLHLGSLGSTLKFTTGSPTQLTSENNFRVVGSQVIGDASNKIGPSGNSDSSGSIKFTGPYTRINFTATPNYTGPADGILVQVVTEPATGTPATTQTPIGTQVGSGECTDWALDRRPDLRSIVSGNAQEWTAQARTAGRPVSKTPTAGAVMVLQGGVMGADASTGHVAYVESVQRDATGNPTSFLVSEQNWNNIRYSTTRTIQVSSMPASGVDFIG
jgi:surface antigen